MKILHVASFIGNIGDNASHIGTYRILDKFFDYKVDRLEIRKAYDNYTLPDKWEFDHQFVDLANEYDLLLIGGGAFLDYFLDNETGTTINMTESLLQSLTPEIVFMSMGCKSRPEGVDSLDKTRQYIEILKKRAHLFFRNDGSTDNFPEIPQVLDSGFFYESYRTPGDYIAVNVANDWCKDEVYVNEMARLVERIKGRVVFVPHNFLDIGAINEVLKRVNSYTVAMRVEVAPYKQGFGGARQLFDIYRNSKQVVASRFHANVCSIAMNKPVVGIEITDKVRGMYESLGSSAVKIAPNMCEELMDRFGETYNIDILKQDTLDKYSRVLSKISNRQAVN